MLHPFAPSPPKSVAEVCAKTEIEAAAITVTEGPATFGDGSASIFFRDPDCNVIELTEAPRGVSKPLEPKAGVLGRQK